MQNPTLIEQIKSLADEKSVEKNEVETVAEEPRDTSPEETTAPRNDGGNKSKRRELLSALKPYLSNERSHAIDAMMSISDILDRVKTR